MAALDSGSRPVVGSSRNSTAGRWISPSATSSRRCMPPEYVLTSRPAASVSPKWSSSSSARGRIESGEELAGDIGGRGEDEAIGAQGDRLFGRVSAPIAEVYEVAAAARGVR